MMTHCFIRGISMRKALSAGMLGLMSAMLLLPPAPARAGLLDSLFGGASSGGESAKGDARRRTWTLHEFTTIRLVPRESGASPNQHPVQVEPETLRQQLTQVRFESRQGGQALFAADELGELTEALAQALSNAGPDDDVLLLSTSRRGGSLLEQPLGEALGPLEAGLALAGAQPVADSERQGGTHQDAADPQFRVHGPLPGPGGPPFETGASGTAGRKDSPPGRVSFCS